jgi:hypothetical protein
LEIIHVDQENRRLHHMLEAEILGS